MITARKLLLVDQCSQHSPLEIHLPPVTFYPEKQSILKTPPVLQSQIHFMRSVTRRLLAIETSLNFHEEM